MPLVICPSCGNQVSEHAASCPKCGEPLARRKSGGWKTAGIVIGIIAFLGIGAVVLIVVFAIGAVTREPPAKHASFNMTEEHSNESCTEIGDYCIQVVCTFTNTGDGPGERSVNAQLLDNGSIIVTKHSDLTLLPGNSQSLIFNFREAELGDEHHYTYRCAPD